MSAVVPLDFTCAADVDRWQQYVGTRRDSHCTDDARWRLLYHELYGFPTFNFAWQDGSGVRGVVSVYLIASPFFGRLLVTSPFFGYGGLYADDGDVRDALLQRIEQVAVEQRADFIELRLTEALPPPYTANADFEEFDLDLDRTSEDCWKQLSSNVRQNIRKSRRHPLRFGLSPDPDPSYTLVSRTVRDLGTPFHGPRYFRLVRKYFPREAWFAQVHHNDTLVASGLVLCTERSLLTPYIGSLKASRSSAANYCQYWGLIEHALQQGIPRFELGRSPRDSTHAQFKTKWGARAVPVYYNYRQLQKGKEYKYTPSDPPRLFVLASAIWKRLPLPITRLVGHRFARYIP